jgi:hypothetical protein
MKKVAQTPIKKQTVGQNSDKPKRKRPMSAVIALKNQHETAELGMKYILPKQEILTPKITKIDIPKTTPSIIILQPNPEASSALRNTIPMSVKHINQKSLKEFSNYRNYEFQKQFKQFKGDPKVQRSEEQTTTSKDS